MKNRDVKIGGIVFGLIGLALLMLALFDLFRSTNLTLRGVETPGKIGELIVKDSQTGNYRDSKGRVFRSRGSLVEYVTSDGKTREFIAAQTPQDSRTGDIITVLYLPSAPEVAELKLFDRLWFNSMFAGIFGLLLLGAGSILYFVLGKLHF